MRPLPWSDLPVVLPAAGLAREAADRWFKRRRVPPRVYGEVPGSEAILSLVSLGCAVGIVPRIVFDKSPLRENARVLTAGADDLGEFRVGVCTQRRKLTSPIVRAFWESMGGEPAPLRA
jgi:LysR family positive regulator for ilvC